MNLGKIILNEQVNLDVVDYGEQRINCQYCQHPNCRYIYVFSQQGKKAYEIGSTCGPRLSAAMLDGRITDLEDIDAIKMAAYMDAAAKILKEALSIRAKLPKLQKRLEENAPIVEELGRRADCLDALYTAARNRTGSWDSYFKYKNECAIWACNLPKGVKSKVCAAFKGYWRGAAYAKGKFTTAGVLEEIRILEERAAELQSGKAYLFAP